PPPSHRPCPTSGRQPRHNVSLSARRKEIAALPKSQADPRHRRQSSTAAAAAAARRCRRCTRARGGCCCRLLLLLRLGAVRREVAQIQGLCAQMDRLWRSIPAKGQRGLNPI
uniref:Uncharacterized protein n=2 Tax=Aegilops tauschii subsp. strangulata TaxID=200361 RepID=A0A453QJD3_AEGTS